MWRPATGSSLWPAGTIALGPLPPAMSLSRELITTSRLLDLNSCRSLCGIPTTITRKKDLVEALLLQAQCPHKRRAVIQHLTGNMTAIGLRAWISSLRRAGHVVPDSRVMGRGRAEIVDAIVHLDCAVGEYSSTQGQTARATARTDSAGEYSSAQGRADSVGQSVGSNNVGPAGEYSSAQGPVGSGDAGMVLVAYDTGSSPEVSRKLGKKWMKLARKAYMRSHLPQRVRKAVEEALQEHPDAAVLKLREVVESKVGVALCGQYGVLFDKALLRGTAKPEKPRRPRKRFVLAVARRQRRS